MPYTRRIPGHFRPLPLNCGTRVTDETAVTQGVCVRKLLGLLLGVCLIATLAPAAPAAAITFRDGGTFNTPGPWGTQTQKYRIIRRIEKAINSTPRLTGGKQSTIYVATFLLDRRRSVDSLIRACRRGVSVRVVIDGAIDSPSSKRLMRTLNGDNVRDRNRNGVADRPPKTGPCGTKRKAGKQGGKNLKRKAKPLTMEQQWGRDRSYVKQCANTCRGKGSGNMHSKFFLFSRENKVPYVVMLSSSNLNAGGAVLGWNDLWTMKNRPRTYRYYAGIHRQMTVDRPFKTAPPITDGPYRSQAFPVRKAKKPDDPTLRDLRRVKCRGPLGRTSVHVSMFYWKGPRGDYLATALLDLARKGCKVNIIYGAPSKKIRTRLQKAARKLPINLYDSRWDFNRDGLIDVRTHAKYVLIKGVYGNQKRAYRVLTGSQNWVFGSLRLSDETTLMISSRKAYNAYRNNWGTIQRHSRRVR